eukprot:gene36729-45306_t
MAGSSQCYDCPEEAPSDEPTESPTEFPSICPSLSPSVESTTVPTLNPSCVPSMTPSFTPIVRQVCDPPEYQLNCTNLFAKFASNRNTFTFTVSDYYSVNDTKSKPKCSAVYRPIATPNISSDQQFNSEFTSDSGSHSEGHFDTTFKDANNKYSERGTITCKSQ